MTTPIHGYEATIDADGVVCENGSYRQATGLEKFLLVKANIDRLERSRSSYRKLSFWDAENTLKHIIVDHPCCRYALYGVIDLLRECHAIIKEIAHADDKIVRGENPINEIQSRIDFCVSRAEVLLEYGKTTKQ